jgi:hypothetical protein
LEKSGGVLAVGALHTHTIQKYTVNNKKNKKQKQRKKCIFTTNWLNVEVNRNYTHRCSFRTSTLSNLELLSNGVIENTCGTHFDNINLEVSEL